VTMTPMRDDARPHAPRLGHRRAAEHLPARFLMLKGGVTASSAPVG
jgi:hypothetical protein